MDKQALLQLLSDNRLEDLFSALKSHPGHYRDMILLESQWNDLRANQRNGLVSSEQANLELARIRKGLLEVIEMSTGNNISAPAPASNARYRTWFLAVAAAVVLFIAYQIYTLFTPADTGKALPANELKTNTVQSSPAAKPAPPKQLDLSEAQPITLAPGDFQYERVYSVVKTAVESTGGGKSLITLTVGLNFKGIINELLSTNNFRLVADELPGPVAPVNYLSILVDSKSYGEGDIKFELSDNISRFSIIIEGKEDKKWHFSR